MTSPKRVALYLRVSTNNGHQTTENQLRELTPSPRRDLRGQALRLERP
jgi:hypothetical protein